MARGRAGPRPAHHERKDGRQSGTGRAGSQLCSPILARATLPEYYGLARIFSDFLGPCQSSAGVTACAPLKDYGISTSRTPSHTKSSLPRVAATTTLYVPEAKPAKLAVPGSPVEEAGLNDRQRPPLPLKSSLNSAATIMSAFCAESGVQLTTIKLNDTRAVTPMGAVTSSSRHLRRIAEGDRQDVLQACRPAARCGSAPLSPSSAARDANTVNVGHAHVVAQSDHAVGGVGTHHQGGGRLSTWRHGYLVVVAMR